MLPPALLLAGLWLPEFMHYRIDRSDVVPNQVEQAAATPADDVLMELGRIDLAELDRLALPVLAVAADVAAGHLQIEGLTRGQVELSGFPGDYLSGPPTFQLFMASLSTENLLLRAHSLTGEESWFLLALQRSLAMAQHERTRRHDRSFLWNDHAVASRVSVLIELWRLVRQRPALRAEHGQALLSFAQRSGRLLAKPDQFTVRTNHGVMQNIALLQLAAAFPNFPEAAGWRALAVERLELQLRFYVSPEGVVLEHSAGYHEMGASLLAHAQRLLVLNRLPPAPALDRAVAQSRAVLVQLMRPDGSLPLVGNTGAGYRYSVPATAAPAPTPAALAAPPTRGEGDLGQYPAAGWAIWRSDPTLLNDSQVMLAWAKHDGHGHKHADEGSLHFWSGGVDWLTATGYWPYGARLLDDAYGWRGANAAHEPGEPENSVRSARLMAGARLGSTRFIDVWRGRAGGPSFRRQVLLLPGDALLVLDFAAASPRGSETLWTLGPELRLLPGERADRFSTAAAADGRRLLMALASPQAGLQTERLRASEDPFGGWVVARGQPQPADSVRVLQPQTASLTVSLFHVSANPAGTVEIARIDPSAAPESWQLSLRVDGQPIELQRRGAELRWTRADGPGALLQLAGPPVELQSQQAELRSAFAEAVERFPSWRDLWRYRIDLSQMILIGVLAIEVGLWLLARWRPARLRRQIARVQLAIVLTWAVLSASLLLVYLKV